MANVCCCYMEATGPVKPIRHLMARIKKQDKKDLEDLFTWFEAGNYYGLCQDPTDLDDDSLCLDFTCKWSPPEAELIRLSETYPDLTFNIRYEEPGCGLYGILVYKAGNLIEDAAMDEHGYREAYDEEYKKVAQRIKTMNYQKFIKNFQKEAERLKDHPLGHLFEDLLLQKIKDKDLPLFINYEWEYASRSFQGRLKEGGRSR